jgi:hypothetical protein
MLIRVTGRYSRINIVRDFGVLRGSTSAAKTFGPHIRTPKVPIWLLRMLNEGPQISEVLDARSIGI